MKHLRQFLIILLFSFLGEGLKALLPLPVPASIYGLVLLFAALELGIIKLSAVEDAGKFLIEIMPVMSGLEAARQIRAMSRTDAQTVPIIAMTANAYEEDVSQSLAAGMNAHLAKPIEPQVILDTLAEYIGSKN